ncbi:MAG: PH domain-containing protein [Micromonosporaceae bacterium]|nr:PH domain-containing protein [Micromonosporaceae bacterium]
MSLDWTGEPRRRLHPLTPLLKGVRGFAVVVAAISLQGFAQLGLSSGAVVVLLAVLGALALSWVSWLVTGYHVVNQELRVYEGLVWRRSRAIALARLQSVEVVRPLLARLTGLAELRLEVVGGAKTEAPLAFLTVAEAHILRDRLLAISEQAHAAVATPETTAGPDGAVPQAARPEPPAPEQRLHQVAPRDLLLAQLLTPQALLTPFTLTASMLMFALNPNMSLIGILGAVGAAVGIALQPIRRVIADYGFTVATVPNGLRLRHGLLETRSQTVPAGRVQALAVTWPLLWRPQRWLRCRIDVAGAAGGGDGEQVRGGALLPVAEPETARQVVARVLPGVDLAVVPLTRVPPQARYRAPLRRRVLAAGLGEHAFAVRHGLITHHLILVPYARIQSIRVSQGPWQRALGLATVYADTAGTGIVAAAEHRDLAEARWLAAELTARARQARLADRSR